MFLKMNIPAIIGDLTGKTVAREIRAMREANAASGDKRFRPSAVNLERGTLTEKVMHEPLDAEALKKAHESKRLDKTSGLLQGEHLTQDSTLRQNDTQGNVTETLSDNATEVLTDSVTELLDSGTTEMLNNKTELLSSEEWDESGGTTVLNETEELEEVVEKPVAFKVVYKEVVVHTEEVI